MKRGNYTTKLGKALCIIEKYKEALKEYDKVLNLNLKNDYAILPKKKVKFSKIIFFGFYILNLLL